MPEATRQPRDFSAAELHALAHSLPLDGSVVFCDDSEVGAADGMLPDVGLLAAIEMTPVAYASAAKRLTSYREKNTLPEFHATDIVAGRRNTFWATVPHEMRLQAFREVSTALVETQARLSYVHLPRSQYEEMRTRLKQNGFDPKLNWKAAMRRVVLRTLIEEADRRSAPTLIVIDQDRPLHGPRLVTSEAAPSLAGGGVLAAPSDQVIGLQLADMAAFCMGRYLRRRPRNRTISLAGNKDQMLLIASEGDDERARDTIAGLEGFDGVVIETVAAFAGRTRSLLRS
ncbi:hypothetical protein NS365_05350 [Aureimonas ureilytica]|uniref:Uncharacterized protein n=1 Tax=Aureimonas ureilytica TaxID=401562 RepID=A0A175RW22_9HYPH|nr:DUF3800 domain-containing protein [Aureimonas ureilytica]KTR07069.1 hypothetical protein NS365_05350 [Aureimonas ureilytica]